VALTVQDEDGVVLDAIDEQAKSPRLLLGIPAVGQVARHLCEPDERALWIPEGGDDDVGPESSAILPHAPTFVFETALAFRHVELVRADRLGVDLGRVKGREVLADDLVGLVPLDAFGAGVPRADVAL
jgi:hypothetical protein